MINHEKVSILINNELVEIDKKCVKAVRFFNEIGLPTRCSCENLNDDGFFTLLFDIDNPLDYNMISFIKKYKSKIIGDFNIWVRPINGKILTTWKLEIPVRFAEESINKLIDAYYKEKNKE